MSELNGLDRRDQQLRRRMYNIIRLAQGWCRATKIADEARDDMGMPCDTDEHARRLIADLLEWGLIQQEHNVETSGVKRTWRHERYRTTPKGQMVWTGEISLPGVTPEDE